MNTRRPKRNAVIEVRQTGHLDPLTFDVAIREAGSETHHHVTLSRADHDRLTRGRSPADRCIEAALRFLLERESKEAILSRFDVSVISRYFPEFESELPRHIADNSAAADES